MLKKLLLLLSLTSAFSFAAPVSVVDGKQYYTVENTTATKNEVIELFSFYCGACFSLEHSGGNETLINNLPKNVKFSRYLLNVSMPISDDLQMGWGIANVLGIQNEFIPQIFNAVFISKKMNTEADIIKVLNNLGVDTKKYNEMKKDPLVISFLKKEKELIATLRPNFTPAIYVNQQYVLNPNALGSDLEAYKQTIDYLLTLPPKKN